MEIVSLLGYKKRYESLDKKLVPKGYRLLSKVKRLTNKDICLLVENFDGLTSIINGTEEDFISIDGIPQANSDNPFLVSSVVLDHLDSSYHNIAFAPDAFPSAARDANGNVPYSLRLKTVKKEK